MSNASTILDHPIVSSRYFFPRMDPIPDPYWVDAVDGSKLACYYQAVHPDAKTVVYFHGNGEVVADYLPDFPEWIARAGYNLLLAEYRGYGMSTGNPALAGMLEDVVPIIQSLNIPDRKIILFGRNTCSSSNLFSRQSEWCLGRPGQAGWRVQDVEAQHAAPSLGRCLTPDLGADWRQQPGSPSLSRTDRFP